MTPKPDPRTNLAQASFASRQNAMAVRRREPADVNIVDNHAAACLP